MVKRDWHRVVFIDFSITDYQESGYYSISKLFNIIMLVYAGLKSNSMEVGQACMVTFKQVFSKCKWVQGDRA
ncbi:hypothetical protein [Roseivirga thermotolerans]|uniref:hypothetical protein n=1 Tax=Roseivirga thermotolerans TaxID=1758176 RepID=UPI00273FE02B|nr:hypothetical protein [Roseivirga thermotolerans]